MSDISTEQAKELDFVDNTPSDNVDDKPSVDDPKPSDVQEENSIPTPQDKEEIIKKKYGGMLSKKHPLISKDHERAFFDSADWALGKQGAQKTKGPSEDLRPKLQPTPHQQLRSRSAYATMDDTEADDDSHKNDIPSKDQSCKLDVSENNPTNSGDQSCSN